MAIWETVAKTFSFIHADSLGFGKSANIPEQ